MGDRFPLTSTFSLVCWVHVWKLSYLHDSHVVLDTGWSPRVSVTEEVSPVSPRMLINESPLYAPSSTTDPATWKGPRHLPVAYRQSVLTSESHLVMFLAQ